MPAMDWQLTNLAPYLLAAAGVLAALALAGLIAARRRARSLSSRMAPVQRALQLIQPEAGLENNLNLFLETVSQVVDAPGYAFYIRDPQNGNYVLRAVRHRRTDPERAEPSYSGLAPYPKEVYLPPLSLMAEPAMERAGIVREGEVPLFQLALDGGRGLIRIGPIARVPGKTRDNLSFLAEAIARTLDVLIESDRLRLQADVVKTSSRALQAISTMATDPEAVLQKTFAMAATALGVSGGCLLVSGADRVEVPVCIGWPRQTAARLADPDHLSGIVRLLGHQEFALWREETPAFEQAKSILGLAGERMLMAGSLPLPGKRAWFLAGFDGRAGANPPEEQLTTTVGMMSAQLARLTALQQRMKPYGELNAEFLKRLAGMIDDLSPYTVGYSELMSRYSIVIARELSLPDEQIRQIGLAAYLSNIGVLGLSEELYLKEGKFTEVEYEKMKLHAEVGAAIIEMTIGNKEIAEAIRHHHERMDGNGYPAGLKGEGIPIGARIIAVVQTFLAKVGGRKYRDPLPFGKAIELLEAAAGTQLDETVVRTFVRWYESKRGGARLGGRALGACYDLCCTPSDICRNCPAYSRPEQNCWEVTGVHCQAHGKSCRTCFVYTETQTRSGTA